MDALEFKKLTDYLQRLYPDLGAELQHSDWVALWVEAFAYISADRLETAIQSYSRRHGSRRTPTIEDLRACLPAAKAREPEWLIEAEWLGSEERMDPEEVSALIAGVMQAINGKGARLSGQEEA